jgi:hypothetical protein
MSVTPSSSKITPALACFVSTHLLMRRLDRQRAFTFSLRKWQVKANVFSHLHDCICGLAAGKQRAPAPKYAVLCRTVLAGSEHWEA